MEEQEILNGNKLIAEFMDWRKTPLCYPFTQRQIERELEYHTSWDWLIPVVEKIGKLYDNLHLQKRPICSLRIFTPIEVLYHWVVDFIQWYASPLNRGGNNK